MDAGGAPHAGRLLAAAGLGVLVLLTPACGELVTTIERTRRLVARRVARLARVSVFVDLGFFTTVPADSLATDLIRQAGGRNVAGRAASGPLDAKQLLALNPAFYLATTDSAT